MVGIHESFFNCDLEYIQEIILELLEEDNKIRIISILNVV